jgi:hypothetical protein
MEQLFEPILSASKLAVVAAIVSINASKKQQREKI